VRWLAPILSFTAEEIWKAMPRPGGDSVFLASWYEIPEPSDTLLDWEALIRVRTAAGKVMEDLRDNKVIGSSLDAAIDVYADGALYETLARLGDELRFLFITSQAAVHPVREKPADARQGERFWVSARLSEEKKCIRCWHRRPDVGDVPAHPEICSRCARNVDGPGEKRVFA